jgi:citrate lyase subunit beta/citryl-CoA lyase
VTGAAAGSTEGVAGSTAAVAGSGERRMRSVLYVPGANERALEKAPGLAADALILDLEDAVAPAAKLEARDRTCSLARAGHFNGRMLAIRVNGLATEWHGDDVRAAVAAACAVLIPKVESRQDMLEAERGLAAAGAGAEVRMWAMLETPAAVLRAAEIATATKRLSVLVVGTNDLAAELRAEIGPGREPLLYSLSACLLAARAAGVAILDGVYNDVRDPAGFERECLQSRRLGFDGKTLIHPGQVDTCNRVFSPSSEELGWARRVIEAFAEAERAGLGVATVDGKLIENVHAANARRVLTLAGLADPG